MFHPSQERMTSDLKHDGKMSLIGYTTGDVALAISPATDSTQSISRADMLERALKAINSPRALANPTTDIHLKPTSLE